MLMKIRYNNKVYKTTEGILYSRMKTVEKKKRKRQFLQNGTDQEKTEISMPTELEKASCVLWDETQNSKKRLNEYYIRMVDEEDSEELDQAVENEIHSLKRTTANLIRTYRQTAEMEDELSARFRDVKKSRKKKKLIPPTPANAVIDRAEQKLHHFASGINLYKLLLVCFTGSFVGVLIELVWCVIRWGHIESRSGLVYGPFNLLYGAGAVVLTVTLYRFRNRGSWVSFLGGMIAGSALEYICSWGQETLLGSRSWDYSDMAFNLNGRICLLYAVFWGFLGVFWIKNIYPRMAALILKLPNRAGKIITWALTAFFVVNIVVTGLSLYRWSARVQGKTPANAVESFIDQRFPDQRMERIFANMVFDEK